MVLRSLQGLTIESLLIVHTVLFSPFQPALGSFFYHQTPIHFSVQGFTFQSSRILDGSALCDISYLSYKSGGFHSAPVTLLPFEPALKSFF